MTASIRKSAFAPEKAPRIILADEYDARKAIKADWYARKIGETLRKHYPGRNWYVDINMDGGIAGVKCADISMKYGYVMHLTSCVEVLQRRAVSVGGEILERFRLSRARHASGDSLDLVRDITGYAKGAKHGGV